MSTPLKVSIITATYNSEKFVDKAIHSVLNQTYRNIEYIIIDGASSDGTLEIVNNFMDRITRLVSEKDGGIYDAFNKGIRDATGDIIYFLNSDDTLYHNQIIEEVVEHFVKNPGISYLYGNVRFLGDDKENSTIYGREFALKDFQKGYAPPHQAVFVKRELFNECGLFDLQYTVAGDFEFSLRCFLKAHEKTLYINKIMANFRIGGVSSSYKTRMKGLIEKEKIINRYFQLPTDFSSVEIQNNALFRTWFEIFLLQNNGVSRVLRKDGIENVAIFGALLTCQYLIKDLELEKFCIKGIIDSNENMQNKSILGYDIKSLQWAKENGEYIDAIIVSIESARDMNVIELLKKTFDGRIQIFSWKELIESYDSES